MVKGTIRGTAIAAAVASLCTMGVAAVGHAADAPKKSVKCAGGNACKAKSDCHTAQNTCSGQNACKGKGWTTEPSKQACEKKGGKVVEG